MNIIAFTTIDFFVIGILAISILIGLSRGFAREALSLVFFALAIYLSGIYYQKAIDLVLHTIPIAHSFQAVLAYILIFFTVLFLGRISTNLITKVLSTVGLSLFDRLLGGVFGAFRGMLVVIVLSTLLALTEIPKSNNWKDALTRPAIETLVGIIHQWLPEDWVNQLMNATDIRIKK